MSSTANKFDVEDYEFKDEREELIDGEVVYKALSGGKHSHIENRVSTNVSHLFDRKKRKDGSGGWWILTEASIQYRKVSEKGRQLTADVAGWKRERVPACPSTFPIEELPDWVCEICHTTRKKDTTIVPETLAADGVEWYWLVDVEDELLTVFHLENGRFYVLKTWSKEDGKVRIPPFETAEFSIPILFGEDAEDE